MPVDRSRAGTNRDRSATDREIRRVAQSVTETAAGLAELDAGVQVLAAATQGGFVAIDARLDSDEADIIAAQADADSALANAATAQATANAAAPQGSLASSGLTIGTDKLAGRDSSGTGAIEAIGVSGGIEFTGTQGIQTSAFTGDVTKTAGGTATTIANNAVTNTQIRDSGALSVIGRSANSSGDPADISATAASGAVLRESGSALGFGTIATAGIADAAVTLAKLANLAAATVIGRASGAGTGVPTALTQANLITILGLLDLAFQSTIDPSSQIDYGGNGDRVCISDSGGNATLGRIGSGLDVAAGTHTHVQTDITDGVQKTVLSADRTNNNASANTIADVTGLSFSVLSGSKYWFRFVIFYTSAATTTGSRWSINGPTTTSLAYYSEYTLDATTRTVNGGNSAYDSPAASNASSLTAGNIAIIEGYIVPSANGTVIARFASEVSSSAIIAKAGSTVQYQKVA